MSMQRIGEYSTDFVLGNLSKSELKVDGFRVSMGSIRYKVFQKNLSCYYCGLKGEFFLLERNASDPQVAKDKAHFNLYARKNGELVLFTKDHILPRSKGGPDALYNLVTACFPCNGLKGSKIYNSAIDKQEFAQVKRKGSVVLYSDGFLAEITKEIWSFMNKQQISKDDLSQRLRVPRGYVEEILGGRNVSLRTLERVALALGAIPKFTLQVP